MTKFEVSDAMVEAAIAVYLGVKPYNPTRRDNVVHYSALKGAISAAIEASGLLEWIAELEARIDHATNAANGFMDKNKNTAKYFLHISDILNPHVEDTTNDQ